ncbi:hypothetical protein [Flavobacterium hibisci]|uniref:hypothetical protein n=1 Tax=Flavobacterium hibisci TaxID=1914462 RepID=UPI001CBB1B51|nr:hypothetical protein [Flavobacterium hibisci]MBZ4043850.1 hypothetical protein [Flavobacterium hibisci]
MKKIILLFFVFCFKNLVGQTLSYSATASYNYITCTGSGLNCSNSSVNYSFSGAPGQDQIVNSSNRTVTKIFNNIPLANSYTFTPSGGYCMTNNGSVQVAQYPSTQSAGNLIANASTNLLISGCFGNAFFSGFTPNNMSIQNLSATNDVCAGERLNLAALPNGYPPEAYNWQYSLDNQATWITVPQKIINGISTNRTTNSNFSIYDILGADHINYFRAIYFRIGYPGRPFSANTIRINYLPCAPLITDVNYEGPKCNGDPIQKLEITFNRPLDATKSESLYQLYVRETTNNPPPIKTTPMFSMSNITYPDESKIYSYSNISNFTSLESGREYEVIYQAQIKHPTDPNPTVRILKGVLVGSKPFTYNDPKPLTFKVIADNPKCHDGKVDITIEADGGTPPYFYNNLNGETEIINGVTHVKRIRFDSSDKNKKTVTIQQAELKEYNIKVTDSNNCIEQ